jgi:hypothetical protein
MGRSGWTKSLHLFGRVNVRQRDFDQWLDLSSEVASDVPRIRDRFNSYLMCDETVSQYCA